MAQNPNLFIPLEFWFVSDPLLAVPLIEIPPISRPCDHCRTDVQLPCKDLVQSGLMEVVFDEQSPHRPQILCMDCYRKIFAFMVTMNVKSDCPIQEFTISCRHCEEAITCSTKHLIVSPEGISHPSIISTDDQDGRSVPLFLCEACAHKTLVFPPHDPLPS